MITFCFLNKILSLPKTGWGFKDSSRELQSERWKECGELAYLHQGEVLNILFSPPLQSSNNNDSTLEICSFISTLTVSLRVSVGAFTSAED